MPESLLEQMTGKNVTVGRKAMLPDRSRCKFGHIGFLLLSGLSDALPQMTGVRCEFDRLLLHLPTVQRVAQHTAKCCEEVQQKPRSTLESDLWAVGLEIGLVTWPNEGRAKLPPRPIGRATSQESDPNSRGLLWAGLHETLQSWWWAQRPAHC